MANYTEIVQIIIPNLTITHNYLSTITLHNPTNLTATIDRPKISFTAFNTRQKIFFTLTKNILLPAVIVEVVTENLSVDIMSPNRFLYLSQLLTCPSTICKEETRMTTTTTTTTTTEVVTMEVVQVARFLGNNDNGINQADTTGYGRVITAGAGGEGYSYQIGKYEVTGSQYAAFLNAIAKTDAAYGLYNTNMGEDRSGHGCAQISRSGAPGSYTYAVMNNTGQRPITYVSWFDCARFCNWMSNGQPRGDQTTRTTENGAYNLNGATSGSAIPSTAIPSNSINPNPGAGATYRVPTENEWYKAAYYKGGNSNTAGYWTYPTQSNNQPGTTIGVNPNQVNYNNAFGHAIDVGSFSGSASAYGTFDQGGNVSEWNDLDNTVGPTRGRRGGYWADASPGPSSARNVENPSSESSLLGFRIVRYS